MPSHSTLRFVFVTASVVLLAGCGGEGSRPEAAAEAPQDTFIRPIEREPLTEADLAGMNMAELSVELPWTRNTMARDAAPGAGAAHVRGARVAGHQGFDRVVFDLDDALPFPGYDIRLAQTGDTVVCGGRTEELAAARSLVVRFLAATASDDGQTWIPRRMGATGASRMARAGAICDEGDTVVWVAELSNADQVRVLELRNPHRLAVDVR